MTNSPYSNDCYKDDGKVMLMILFLMVMQAVMMTAMKKRVRSSVEVSQLLSEHEQLPMLFFAVSSYSHGNAPF